MNTRTAAKAFPTGLAELRRNTGFSPRLDRRVTELANALPFTICGIRQAVTWSIAQSEVANQGVTREFGRVEGLLKDE